MASKKFIELQEFTEDQLVGELNQTESQYQKLKFDHALKGLENPLALKEVRRDIARLKTEIRRREIAAMSEDQLALRTKKLARRRK